MGDTLDYCTTESTTLTGWFAQLPPDEFCTPFDVGVSSTGSPFTNNQIDWVILSENGATLLEGGAPYTDEVCLPNGCYTLEMFYSAGYGWGSASLTITNPDGAVVGKYTTESGNNDSASFCVEAYDGPAPTVNDYIQVVFDELNITSISSAYAGFDCRTRE